MRGRGIGAARGRATIQRGEFGLLWPVESHFQSAVRIMRMDGSGSCKKACRSEADDLFSQCPEGYDADQPGRPSLICFIGCCAVMMGVSEGESLVEKRVHMQICYSDQVSVPRSS
jgi:hypothetical protein